MVVYDFQVSMAASYATPIYTCRGLVNTFCMRTEESPSAEYCSATIDPSGPPLSSPSLTGKGKSISLLGITILRLADDKNSVFATGQSILLVKCRFGVCVDEKHPG